MKGDKGQIYLITTIIIIAVVIGFCYDFLITRKKQDSVKNFMTLGERV